MNLVKKEIFYSLQLLFVCVCRSNRKIIHEREVMRKVKDMENCCSIGFDWIFFCWLPNGYLLEEELKQASTISSNVCLFDSSTFLLTFALKLASLVWWLTILCFFIAALQIFTRTLCRSSTDNNQLTHKNLLYPGVKSSYTTLLRLKSFQLSFSKILSFFLFFFFHFFLSLICMFITCLCCVFKFLDCGQKEIFVINSTIGVCYIFYVKWEEKLLVVRRVRSLYHLVLRSLVKFFFCRKKKSLV